MPKGELCALPLAFVECARPLCICWQISDLELAAIQADGWRYAAAGPLTALFMAKARTTREMPKLTSRALIISRLS